MENVAAVASAAQGYSEPCSLGCTEHSQHEIVMSDEEPPKDFPFVMWEAV